MRRALPPPRVECVIGCVVTSCSAAAAAASSAATPLRALANPANEALVGTARPYFPRGGPVPAREPPGLTRSSAGWGGLDAGQHMLYPVQCVDGLVHQHGGRALREMLLAAAPVVIEDGGGAGGGDPVRCRIGDAVLTEAPPSLPFDVIVHTPPPFWGDAAWEARLAACYSSVLRLGSRAALGAGSRSLVVATPIMGAGARGAPVRAAARVLAHAIVGGAGGATDYDDGGGTTTTAARRLLRDVVVRVVVPDERALRVMVEEIDAVTLARNARR
jgi:O-acetyl-ADP-ribose deacetylase (regulator of RNase III)